MKRLIPLKILIYGLIVDIRRAINRASHSGDTSSWQTVISIMIGMLFLFIFNAGASLFFRRCMDFADSAVPLATKIISLGLSMAWPLIFLSASVSAIWTLLLQPDTRLIISTPAGHSSALWLGFARIAIRAGGIMTVLSFAALSAMVKPLFLPSSTYLWILAALIPYTLSAIAPACLFAVYAGAYLRIQRTRQILLLLLLFAGTAMVATLRITEPERLMNPTNFKNFEEFIFSLSVPVAPLLPGEWVGQSILAHAAGLAPWNWIITAWLTTLTMIALLWLSSKVYIRAWNRSYGRGGSSQTEIRPFKMAASSFTSTMFRRDMALLARDALQSTQMSLFVVVIGLYIFNITRIAIPDRPSFIAICLFNSGFALAVTAAVCARFLYTTFSSEGKGLRLIFSAPGGRESLLFSKIVVNGLPCIILAVILATGGWIAIMNSGSMLRIPANDLYAMRNATILNTLIIAPSLVLMALAAGTICLDTSDRPTETKALSPGAIIYMCAAGTLLMITLGIQFIIPMMPAGPYMARGTAEASNLIQLFLTLVPAITTGALACYSSMRHIKNMEI